SSVPPHIRETPLLVLPQAPRQPPDSKADLIVSNPFSRKRSRACSILVSISGWRSRQSFNVVTPIPAFTHALFIGRPSASASYSLVIVFSLYFVGRPTFSSFGSFISFLVLGFCWGDGFGF